jgi:two-component sensor histidine kinase
MVSVGVGSVTEIDLRLKEANHRIKNSLQLVCSLLRLQALNYPDARLEAELFQASWRIASIAKVHDRLCRADNSSVEVAAYLHDLCADLTSSLSLTPRQSVRVTAAHITVPTEFAISLGLVVTELVTNALKHAYRDGQAGKIQVAFIILADGSAQLTIADKGVGLPEGVEMADHGGLGMQFLRSLCCTLKAQMEIDRTPPGTCFTLRLPPIESPVTTATIYV